MTDLAVVIVSWNSEAVIGDALHSLREDLSSSGLRHVIWVVDCASTDGAVNLVRRDFPDVKLLACEDNIGFGRANNLALRRIGFDSRAAKDDLPSAVYLINPDTVTQAGATKTLYEALFARDENGVVGARLSFGDGSFQHSAFRFPDLRQLWTELLPTPGRWVEGAFNGRYARSRYQAGRPFEVDFVLGATMMLKRAALMETGLFDERFFVYCEEVDWQWRMRERGWRILCVPKAHVIHLGGGSSSQAAPESMLQLWKSRLQYYDKHYDPRRRWLARRFIRLGMKRRMASLSDDERDLHEACRRVIELASA